MIYSNIYMIVAMTEKSNAIGKNNDMLYHLPEDLKYFKETTSNEVIVCGYNTWLSFPKKPLPNRTNIVLSRQERDVDGAILMHSVDEVLYYADRNPDKKIFICGGDKIYKQFMEFASMLYVTEIEENNPVDADTFFPEIDKNIWAMEAEKAGEGSNPSYTFRIYVR